MVVLCKLWLTCSWRKSAAATLLFFAHRFSSFVKLARASWEVACDVWCRPARHRLGGSYLEARAREFCGLHGLIALW